MILIDPENALY